jgi:hypothetical protein
MPEWARANRPGWVPAYPAVSRATRRVGSLGHDFLDNRKFLAEGARVGARPFDMLVSLAMRYRGGHRYVAERWNIAGGGRIHARIFRCLRSGPMTSRQVARAIEHSYDATAAMMSVLRRNGVLRVVDKASGPTGMPASRYALR